MDNGRTAIVTGAGSGIGKATAAKLLAEGWNTVFVGRRKNLLDEAAAEASKAAAPGAKALAVACDVTKPAEVDALFAEVDKAFGRVDLLFNNAGIGFKTSTIDEVPVEVWNEVVAVNLTGSFLVARAAFAAMRRQKPMGGRIINNGSISAHAPRPGSVPYTATKHAITGLTKTLALDGRPFDIACGQIDIGNALTEMAASMTDRHAAGKWHHGHRTGHGLAARRRSRRLHGQPAARFQRAVHDRHGDQDAVRRAGVGRSGDPLGVAARSSAMDIRSSVSALWRRLETYAAHDDPLVAAGNWIALVVVSNQPFYPLYLYAIVGDRLAPSLVTFLSTPFFAAVPAVSRRHPVAGRAMLPLIGIANVVVSAKAMGVASGVEMFLIPCALIAASLFRPSERKVGLPIVGLALAAYFVLHGRYGAPFANYSAAEYSALFSLNAVSAATLTVFVGLLLAGIVARGEGPAK